MFSTANLIQAVWSDFRIENMMMRYSAFVPRLYNYCKSQGFTAGKIMPSRAFCSDENQGYPIILIAKHFGTFPFNHGMVGGIVDTGRHGPHAEHGKDLVIIQASHVGYDPDTKTFGVYRRNQTTCQDQTHTCGKLAGVISWYQQEYQYALDNVFLEYVDGQHLVCIDNQIMNPNRKEGLFLNLDNILQRNDSGDFEIIRAYSTTKSYRAAEHFINDLMSAGYTPGDKQPIGTYLQPDLFRYKRQMPDEVHGYNHIEQNLLQAMPWIVTSHAPLLRAAQINTQVEFDHTFRSLVREKKYKGKKVVYVAGLNIDISPKEQLFPLTKFVPWAAYVQNENGEHYTLEQAELMNCLMQQSTDNPDQINLEDAIHTMESAKEIKLHFS